MLTLNSRGSDVVRLQKKLREAGYKPGAADGVYGAKTKAAVAAYQRAHHLSHDGVVGAKTSRSLFGSSDKKYFDGSSEEFLRIIDTGEEKWIGKVVKAGPVVTEVEDIQRNIVSIMRRVAPGARVAPSGIRIFVLQGAALGSSAIIDDEGDDADPAASGPYITL